MAAPSWSVGFSMLLSSQPAAAGSSRCQQGRCLAAPLIPEHIWQNCPSLRVPLFHMTLAHPGLCCDLPLPSALPEPANSLQLDLHV